MKAIQVGAGDGHPLAWVDVPEPAIGPDDVLVQVHAAAINRADLLQRAGNYPPPPGASSILGLDLAGEIVQTGGSVSGWKIGDRVCALVGGGAYAERAAVPQGMLMPIPRGMTYEDAAAIPEVFLTAFVNLFMEASYQDGETVLVHGGASGVGTAAIQLVAATGGHIIATVGSEEKAAACRALGAELAINYRDQDFVERTREQTGGQGVDIILDMVGADYLARNLALLKLRGRLVFISTLSGARAELDLRQVMGKRLRLIGSVLRSRSPAERSEIRRRFMERFWPLIENGRIRPVVDSVYPIQDAEVAHRRMAENKNIGKIVLSVTAQ